MYSEPSQINSSVGTKTSPAVAAFGNLSVQQGELHGVLHELRERLEPILSPRTDEKGAVEPGRQQGESPLVEEVLRATEREVDSLRLARDILSRLTV